MPGACLPWPSLLLVLLWLPASASLGVVDAAASLVTEMEATVSKANDQEGSVTLQESQSGTLDLERVNVNKKRKDPPLTTGRMLPDGTYAMVMQPTGYTDRWCASSCKRMAEITEKARKSEAGKREDGRNISEEAMQPSEMR